jgi:hypothetical protein
MFRDDLGFNRGESRSGNFLVDLHVTYKELHHADTDSIIFI